MDQAASILSSPSSALYISFFPTLSASPVPLPPNAVLIIANSLVVSDKAVTAKTNYNLRVVETLSAARALVRLLGPSVQVGEREKVTLREVLGRWVGEKKVELGFTSPEEEEKGIEELMEGLERIIEKLEGLKPKGFTEGGQTGVTLEEMVEMSGLERKVFEEIYFTSEGTFVFYLPLLILLFLII
jgi:galactokinase